MSVAGAEVGLFSPMLGRPMTAVRQQKFCRGSQDCSVFIALYQSSGEMEKRVQLLVGVAVFFVLLALTSKKSTLPEPKGVTLGSSLDVCEFIHQKNPCREREEFGMEVRGTTEQVRGKYHHPIFMTPHLRPRVEHFLRLPSGKASDFRGSFTQDGSYQWRGDFRFVIEETGLHVPFQYDCLKWGIHQYHLHVVSRLHRCRMQQNDWEIGMQSTWVTPPLVDEEYAEMVAVYQAVLRAASDGDTFTMIEAGCRWGTWAFRAAKLFLQHRPRGKVSLLLLDVDDLHHRGIDDVARANGIPPEMYQYVGGAIDDPELVAKQEAAIRSWVGERLIDVVDYDVQGAEKDSLPKLATFFELRAKTVIVGTHQQGQRDYPFQSQLWGPTFPAKHWELESWLPIQHPHCFSQLGAWQNPASRFDTNWTAANCFNDTAFGQVTQWDGEMIYHNKRFRKPPRTSGPCVVQCTRAPSSS